MTQAVEDQKTRIKLAEGDSLPAATRGEGGEAPRASGGEESTAATGQAACSKREFVLAAVSRRSCALASGGRGVVGPIVSARALSPAEDIRCTALRPLLQRLLEDGVSVAARTEQPARNLKCVSATPFEYYDAAEDADSGPESMAESGDDDDDDDDDDCDDGDDDGDNDNDDDDDDRHRNRASAPGPAAAGEAGAAAVGCGRSRCGAFYVLQLQRMGARGLERFDALYQADAAADAVARFHRSLAPPDTVELNCVRVSRADAHRDHDPDGYVHALARLIVTSSLSVDTFRA